ncbi:MAG TPA: hypothetical protein VFK40_08845 [Nitrososphaeraceae archaeon]|nr:hypothetical protein [Nitrososphaeraceae archaeon]
MQRQSGGFQGGQKGGSGPEGNSGPSLYSIRIIICIHLIKEKVVL